MIFCNSERRKFYSPKSSVINITKLHAETYKEKQSFLKLETKRRTY